MRGATVKVRWSIALCSIYPLAFQSSLAVLTHVIFKWHDKFTYFMKKYSMLTFHYFHSFP